MGYRALVLLLLAVTVGYLMLARNIELDPWSAEELVTSRTLPTLYGALLSLVLLALLITRHPGNLAARQIARTGWMLLMLVAFVALVPLAGIWPASAALLLGALLLLGERRPAVLLGLPSGIALVGWLLVEQLLGIYVPGAGLWSGA
ncbi:MAG: tripartite tricarboxylate transporter TctB family protein [Pseudomonadales bacterium]